MQVYDSDKTGIIIVFKRGKVIAELGQIRTFTLFLLLKGEKHIIVCSYQHVVLLHHQ